MGTQRLALKPVFETDIRKLVVSRGLTSFDAQWLLAMHESMLSKLSPSNHIKSTQRSLLLRFIMDTNQEKAMMWRDYLGDFFNMNTLMLDSGGLVQWFDFINQNIEEINAIIGPQRSDNDKPLNDISISSILTGSAKTSIYRWKKNVATGNDNSMINPIVDRLIMFIMIDARSRGLEKMLTEHLARVHQQAGTEVESLIDKPFDPFTWELAYQHVLANGWSKQSQKEG